MLSAHECTLSWSRDRCDSLGQVILRFIQADLRAGRAECVYFPPPIRPERCPGNQAMNKHALWIAFGCLLATGAVAAENTSPGRQAATSQQDLAPLQGRWRAVKLQIDNEPSSRFRAERKRVPVCCSNYTATIMNSRVWALSSKGMSSHRCQCQGQAARICARRRHENVQLVSTGRGQSETERLERKSKRQGGRKRRPSLDLYARKTVTVR